MDCLQILTGCRRRILRIVWSLMRWMRLTDCLRIFTGFGGRALRIAYGFRSGLEEKAYGLFANVYRM